MKALLFFSSCLCRTQKKILRKSYTLRVIKNNKPKTKRLSRVPLFSTTLRPQSVPPTPPSPFPGWMSTIRSSSAATALVVLAVAVLLGGIVPFQTATTRGLVCRRFVSLFCDAQQEREGGPSPSSSSSRGGCSGPRPKLFVALPPDRQGHLSVLKAAFTRAGYDLDGTKDDFNVLWVRTRGREKR